MIQSIRQFGRGIGREMSRTWDSVARGWRELLHKSGNALTRFRPKPEAVAGDPAHPRFPTWSLLAGEVADAGDTLVVRLEVPGVTRDDCDVRIERDVLHVSGEKNIDREMVGASYYVMERAYGRFSRVIPLPVPVDASRAKASYRNGVLTVEAPKLHGAGPRRITIH